VVGEVGGVGSGAVGTLEGLVCRLISRGMVDGG
jgi:hypothetical protein